MKPFASVQHLPGAGPLPAGPRNLLNGRLRWCLVIWMFLMSAVAYLDRVNISIAGQSVQEDFGLTNIQLGWVFSAFVIGYALFQVPGGRLADRFGARLVISVGVLWWGVFTTITAWVPPNLPMSLALLIGVRFLLGLGEAVVYPSSNRLVSNWIPSSERGLANGLIFAGVGAGAGVTPPIIIYVVSRWGWQWSFYVSALIGLATGVIWYLIARDRPKDHPLASREEIDYIERGLPAHDPDQSPSLPLRTILRSRNVWGITLAYFAFGYVAYIFFTWFFIYLSRERGLDLKSSAFFSMLPFIAMAVFAPVGGWVADLITRHYGKRPGRCGVAIVSFVFAAIFIIAATLVDNARLASLVLAGGAGALYLAQSAFWSVTADIGGKSAGTTSGIMNMGGQIGGTTTASLTPWIADHFGWTASFLLAAGLCLGGAIAWCFVNPDSPIRKR